MIYYVEVTQDRDGGFWVQADSAEAAEAFVYREIIPSLEYEVVVREAKVAKENLRKTDPNFFDATKIYKGELSGI